MCPTGRKRDDRLVLRCFAVQIDQMEISGQSGPFYFHCLSVPHVEPECRCLVLFFDKRVFQDDFIDGAQFGNRIRSVGSSAVPVGYMYFVVIVAVYLSDGGIAFFYGDLDYSAVSGSRRIGGTGNSRCRLFF